MYVTRKDEKMKTYCLETQEKKELAQVLSLVYIYIDICRNRKVETLIVYHIRTF